MGGGRARAMASRSGSQPSANRWSATERPGLSGKPDHQEALGKECPPIRAGPVALMSRSNFPTAGNSEHLLTRSRGWRRIRGMKQAQAAAHCVTQATENGGPMIFAWMGMMQAINRHRVREFDTSRKPHHWGKQSSGGTNPEALTTSLGILPRALAFGQLRDRRLKALLGILACGYLKLLSVIVSDPHTVLVDPTVLDFANASCCHASI